MMGKEDVVRIQRRDEAAARLIDGAVAGGAAALVALAEKADAGIGKGGDRGRRIVAAAVIHHHDLEILASLRQHRGDGLTQRSRPVIDRDDHGEERLAHNGASIRYVWLTFAPIHWGGAVVAARSSSRRLSLEMVHWTISFAFAELLRTS